MYKFEEEIAFLKLKGFKPYIIAESDLQMPVKEQWKAAINLHNMLGELNTVYHFEYSDNGLLSFFEIGNGWSVDITTGHYNINCKEEEDICKFPVNSHSLLFNFLVENVAFTYSKPFPSLNWYV